MRRFTLLLVLLISFGAAKAQLTVTIQDSIICAGDTVWVKASGMDTYEWTPDTKLDTNMGDSVNFQTGSTEGNNTFSVSVIGYDTIAMDTDTVVFTIQVTSLPIINVISSTDPDNGFLCLGSTATLTASGSASIESYLWAPDSTLDNDSTQIVMATPTGATLYSVLATDTNGCSRMATEQVNVNIAKPIIGLVSNNLELCPRQTTVLSASAASATFSWTPSGTLSSSTGSPVTASPTTTTTYTVTARANGCDTSRSITVEVLPIPAMTVSQNPTTAICLDGEVFMNVDCDDCTSYEWIFPGSILQTTFDTITVSPNTPGANEIELLGFGDNGCSAQEFITVQVDSCFNGTPFGIADLENLQSQAYNSGNQVVIKGATVIDAVDVYSLTGQKVVSQTPAAKQSSFDVSTFQSGLYIVLVKSGSATESHKVLIP